MNENLYKLLKVGRKINEKFRTQAPAYSGNISAAEANALICSFIDGNSPAMICRFGSTELNCIATYHNMKFHPKDYVGYLKGDIDFLSWDKPDLHTLEYVSGFFPVNSDTLEKFSQLMTEDMTLVDVLGSWCRQERFFRKELAKATLVNLPHLEPYYHKEPWSEGLRGKKVLLVHPFESSIHRQYQKRELLFTDKRVLPEFELKTYKTIQSLANQETKFKNWFDALNYMKDQIGQIDFDIAIIGCGAYGFPLAAHVKRLGRKAVHLGGATQILFGIKGKRWENIPKVAALMNEHWERPMPEEVPGGSEKVEGGAYW